MIQGIIDAQEKEKDQLAYALHENVNQILTSAKLMLEVAVTSPAMQADLIDRSLPYIREAIAELRRMSQGLRPSALMDISLEAAVRDVVMSVNLRNRVRVAYQFANQGAETVEYGIKLIVLRAVEELLDNVLKHAGAEKAEVIIIQEPTLLRCTVSDNGNGFNPEKTEYGAGLNNIINRIEFHNGQITISSYQDEGTRISIIIPL